MSELLGKRVLLATDGSEGAELAARAAAEVAEGTGCALHVVYVEPLPERSGISMHAVSQIQRDQVDPHVTTMRKLAHALEVEPRELTRKP